MDEMRQNHLLNKTCVVKTMEGEQKSSRKKPQTDKMAGQSPDAIEMLEEILGSLRITEDNTSQTILYCDQQ